MTKNTEMTGEQTALLERVELALIHPCDKNFTRDFTSQAFLEIRDSIKEMGVQQPPRVRASKSKSGMYETVQGHRRLQSLRDLGASHVDCFVCSESDDDVYMLKSMVVENVARENACEYEIAERLSVLADAMGVSLAQAGESLGFAMDRCSNYKRLLGAPASIKALSMSGQSNDLRGLSDMARAVDRTPEAESVIEKLAMDGVSGRKIAQAMKGISESELGDDFNPETLVRSLGYEPATLSQSDPKWKEILGEYRVDSRKALDLDSDDGLMAAAGSGAINYGDDDFDDFDDMIMDGAIGGVSKKQSKPKKTASDDEDKQPRIREVAEFLLEPILCVYKEKKGKNGKLWQPEPSQYLLLTLKTGKQELQFKLPHSEGMMFLQWAGELREKIASGSEGERREILCALPKARTENA